MKKGAQGGVTFKCQTIVVRNVNHSTWEQDKTSKRYQIAAFLN